MLNTRAPKGVSLGYNQGAGRVAFLSEGSRGEPTPFPILTSGVCEHPLAYGPFHVAWHIYRFWGLMPEHLSLEGHCLAYQTHQSQWKWDFSNKKPDHIFACHLRVPLSNFLNLLFTDMKTKSPKMTLKIQEGLAPSSLIFCVFFFPLRNPSIYIGAVILVLLCTCDLTYMLLLTSLGICCLLSGVLILQNFAWLASISSAAARRHFLREACTNSKSP